MRALLLLAAGCGRLGFGSSEPPEVDAPPMIDAAPDAYVIPGTIARYSMDDDPSDGVIADESGNDRPARCVVGGNCPTQIAGKVGMALHLDGTSQAARITNDAVFASPKFTIAVWVLLDDATMDRVAVAKPHGTGSDDSWGFVAWTANMTCLETTSAPSTRYDACTTFSTPANRWVHYAGTFDGTERALYIDGIRQAQLVNATPIAYDTHDIIVGGDENGGTPAYRWQGGIDELYIFDRALTPDEIAKLAGL